MRTNESFCKIINGTFWVLIMKYTDNKLSKISFPVGGIGAGCIGLSGWGALIDWEIFNSPNKSSTLGVTHFAVRAEKNDEVVDFRLLQGDIPLSFYPGNGYGPSTSYLSGWPHFENCEFNGSFPTARLTLSDARFPGKPSLNAWSPFIPGDSRTASMPVACFDIDITNDTDEEYTYSCIGVLSNPWHGANRKSEIRERTIFCESGEAETSLLAQDLSLTLVEGDGEFSYQTHFYRGTWMDYLEMYYRDAMRGGNFIERKYTDEPIPPSESADVYKKSDHSLLCIRFKLRPGESKRTRFAFSWNAPLRENNWNAKSVERAKQLGIPNRWRNYYATQWNNSLDSANEFSRRHNEIHKAVTAFRDALFSTTMAESVIEGASANLSTLISPTCLRLEDGTFYGWEGVGTDKGSCEGSCTHVWNYAQALPFLFPDLERSMREANFKYGVDENGGSHFRILLPLGIKANPDDFRPCADGQFGDVMKSYRDWKISGDNEWLSKWWPVIRSLVAYAWSDKNPDRWDPDRSGILTGRQHHTLDMELFGANAWLSSHYLGALKAAVEMALAVEDFDFVAECDEVLMRGTPRINDELFEDGLFIQNIDLKDKSIPDSFDASDKYWNDEAGEIKYQIGKGCEIDSALGQFHASLYGLGDILDPEKVKSHLLSVYKRNYSPKMRDFFNPWRNFTINDEAGVIMCTWDNEDLPAIPLSYNSETMNGFEWTYAAHLALVGLTDKATEIANAIRNRYDGEKRNPWNEIECGNNYARSMAAYGVIVAWSGFHFDMPRKEIGFAPKTAGDFTTFWSIGTAWGTFSVSADGCRLDVISGELPIETLRLDFSTPAVYFNGKLLAKGEENCWNI